MKALFSNNAIKKAAADDILESFNESKDGSTASSRRRNRIPA
jgi:hypothetical protein